MALGLVLASAGSVRRRRCPRRTALEFFEKSVRPVLVERCQTCHGATKQKGGPSARLARGGAQGGETGPAVVPGKPGESLLVGAVNYGDDLQMPPKSRLAAAEVAALTRWVEMGVPWPAEAAHGEPPSASAAKGFDLKGRKAAHWAWATVEPKAPPEVNDASWPRDPIDRFLLARLEDERAQPAHPTPTAGS